MLLIVEYIFNMVLIKNNSGTYNLLITHNNTRYLCTINGNPVEFDDLESGEDYINKIKKLPLFSTFSTKERNNNTTTLKLPNTIEQENRNEHNFREDEDSHQRKRNETN